MKKDKLVKEMELEEIIRVEFYTNKKPIRKISEELDIPYSAVQRFLRDAKVKNYTDERLSALTQSRDSGPLEIIDDFFEAASYGRQELAYTALIGQMLREEIMSIIAQGGIEALTSEDKVNTVNLWFKNSEKLSKLSANSPKYLDTIINLYTQVLDLQRQVSFVKIVTDELSNASPELHKKIFDNLAKDPAARAVMASISNEQIVEYWASDKTNPGRANAAKKAREENVLEAEFEED